MVDKKSVCESTSRIIEDFEDHVDAEDYGRFRGFFEDYAGLRDHEDLVVYSVCFVTRRKAASFVRVSPHLLRLDQPQRGGLAGGGSLNFSRC